MHSRWENVSSKSDYDMSYYDDDSMSLGLLYQKFHHKDIKRLKWIIIVPIFFLFSISFQKIGSSNKNLIKIWYLHRNCSEKWEWEGKRERERRSLFCHSTRDNWIKWMMWRVSIFNMNFLLHAISHRTLDNVKVCM